MFYLKTGDPRGSLLHPVLVPYIVDFEWDSILVWVMSVKKQMNYR